MNYARTPAVPRLPETGFRLLYTLSRAARRGMLVAFLVVMGNAIALEDVAVPIRSEVAKPLQLAQDALKDNKPQNALDIAQQTLAIAGLTSREREYSLRIVAIAANGLSQWHTVASALRELLQLPNIKAEERLVMTETLLNSLWNMRDYEQFVKSARTYLQSGGGNTSVFTLMLRSLAAQDRQAELISEVKLRVAQMQAKGAKTAEVDIVLMAQAQLQLKSDEGYLDALVTLVTQYPSKVRWDEVIRRTAMTSDFNARNELDIYRLLGATENLVDATDFDAMANLASKAGLPCEARQVLQQGLDKRALSGANVAERLGTALKQCQDETTQLSALMRTARDASALKAIADVFASQQNWLEANAMYAKALEAGIVRRPDELHLHFALALYKSGNKAAAQSQWEQVKQDPTARRIARLWSVLAHQN